MFDFFIKAFHLAQRFHLSEVKKKHLSSLLIFFIVASSFGNTANTLLSILHNKNHLVLR